MLREPQSEKASVPTPATGRDKRFRIVKLEERIAPTAHTNPQTNQVGNDGNAGKGGHHSGSFV
jgi:hypothetical protein